MLCPHEEVEVMGSGGKREEREKNKTKEMLKYSKLKYQKGLNRIQVCEFANINRSKLKLNTELITPK